MTGNDKRLVYRVLLRLGRWIGVRPAWVCAFWLVVAGGLAGAVLILGAPTNNDVTLPGSDAQTGRDLLSAHVSGADNATGQIVLRVNNGRLDDPPNHAAITQTAEQVAEVRHVVHVDLPSYATESLSADGRTGYLTVTMDVNLRGVDHQLAETIDEAAAPARTAGIQAVSGGILGTMLDDQDTRTSEILGLAVALIVLVFAFRGLVAALLPIATAVVTLVCGLSVIGLAGHVATIPPVASSLAAMIGIGVGIDYALFLVTRYRELLADDVPMREAIARSVASSGSAIVFAGGTVVVALGGLTAAGVPVLRTLAWCCGLVVVLAVAGATTLLPALLVLLGPRIDSLRLAVRPTSADASFWSRQADRVTRRPWLYLVATTALLAALAAPVLAMTLGQTDSGDNPNGTPSRTSFTLLSDAFGPGVNGPLTVVASMDPPADGYSDSRLSVLAMRVAATPGVASVSPVSLSPDRAVAMAIVYPTTAPSESATASDVTTLREITIDGLHVHVTGPVAAKADLARMIDERMPAVISIVVALAALLLLTAFRAPVIALKAAIMNLVSIGAAYGALTVIVAWGWGSWLTRLPGPVPIESYVPLMLFALLFGLSMDYEVFLLTAVQEAWRATGDNLSSVRQGLARTGRVITSAALIMVCVFASFVLQASPIIKMFGLGMAVAIAVDATIVRGLLVPATMALLGRANWWVPSDAASRQEHGRAGPGR